MHLLDINKSACGNINQFEVNGECDVLLHGTTHETHFAAVIKCGFDHLLHPVDVAGERCRNDAAITMFVEQLSEHSAHALLARCMTMLFSVRAVTHQQANTNGGCQFTQARKVCSTVVDRREIKLEITRVHDDTLGCVDDDCVCVRHRVRHGQELNIKRSDVDALTITNSDKACFL